MPQPAQSPAAPLSRRAFLARVAKWTAAPGLLGAYASQIETFWFDVKEIPIPIPKLPAAFEGYRIAHLTDLHASDIVPMAHLERAVQLTRSLKPDCVVVTGDLVTHTFDYIRPVAELLQGLELPTFVSFGNHDYDPMGAGPGPVRILSEPLQFELERAGCTVLRNRALPIEKSGQRLWMVGLEDLYTDAFKPADAFAHRPLGEACICLSHNPDSTEDLLPYRPELILSGHTHGGQIRLPFWGAIMLPVFHRHRDQGQWILPYGRLYISRGVGFLRRARLLCRPEIPCYVLHRG